MHIESGFSHSFWQNGQRILRISTEINEIYYIMQAVEHETPYKMGVFYEKG